GAPRRLRAAPVPLPSVGGGRRRRLHGLRGTCARSREPHNTNSRPISSAFPHRLPIDAPSRKRECRAHVFYWSPDAGGAALSGRVVLHAPLSGWLCGLEEVPDEVFAGGMMGDGIAIDPLDGELVAPCDGVVAVIAPTAHAVTVRAPNGAEILLHIGVDTVGLEGFTAHVTAGQKVRLGDRLISFDLDAVALAAKSVVTPILVTGERQKPGLGDGARHPQWRHDHCDRRCGHGGRGRAFDRSRTPRPRACAGALRFAGGPGGRGRPGASRRLRGAGPRGRPRLPAFL